MLNHLLRMQNVNMTHQVPSLKYGCYLNHYITINYLISSFSSWASFVSDLFLQLFWLQLNHFIYIPKKGLCEYLSIFSFMVVDLQNNDFNLVNLKSGNVFDILLFFFKHFSLLSLPKVHITAFSFPKVIKIRRPQFSCCVKVFLLHNVF